MDVNNNEIAWAAGLFEGEGCIYSYQHKHGQGMRLQMYLTDEDVLRHFAECVNGRVTGPYQDKHHEHYKPQWSWTEAKQDAVTRILTDFWPYLGKRRQLRAIELGFKPAIEHEFV